MSLLPLENSPNDLFSFSGSVGRLGDNNRDDVIKVQALLANAGYYELPDPGMPTGWPGGELNRALTRFQKDNGLDPDGTLVPIPPGGVSAAGEGETAQALQTELGRVLQGFAAPSVQEADDFYRIRPRLGDEGEPPTAVGLRSANSTGEYVGLKQIATDAPSADYELKPGQQEARAGSGGTLLARQPARLPVTRPPAMTPQHPPATPPQYGPYPAIPRERLPDEQLRNPSIIQRLQEPNPENGTGPTGKLPPIENTPNAPGLGRIIIAEDGKELHVPPLGTWAKDLNPEDREIADGLSDAFAIELAKRPGSRGDEWTQKGIDMYVQGCLEAAKEDLPKLAESLKHIAGGTEDNEGKIPVTEEYLANVIDGMKARLGSGRSDFTLEFSRNVVQRFRANTTSKLADGTTNTPDEQRRLENMDRLTLGNGDYVAEFPKFPKGMSDAEMKKQARRACGEELSKWFEDIARTGEFEKPTPETKDEYSGHRILDDLKQKKGLKK